MSEQNKNISDGLLDRTQLKEFLCIKGDATLWRYLKDGNIPQPKINLSRNRQWWDKNEVIEYLDKNSKK